MKCGPDDCPIRAFSDLTPAEQRVERKRIAKKMYDQGFTMEQVAKQLGVDKATISRDLELLHDATIKKPARTTSNPKGAGRPKGAVKTHSVRSPKAKQREEKVAILADAGLTTAEIAAEVGLGERAVNQALEHVAIKREAEAQIDPATLSQTAQEKLAAAIRQHQRKLDTELEVRVRDGIQAALEDTVLPHYNERLALYNKVNKAWAGIMDRPTYRLIWSCLHTDSRASVSDQKLNKAFNAWSELEDVVLRESENRNRPSTLPRNYEELMARKRAVQEARRSRRPSAQSVTPR